MRTEEVVVQINSIGTGVVPIKYQAMSIEMVRVKNGLYGTPAIKVGGDQTFLEVLGAIPDSKVTVTYDVHD